MRLFMRLICYGGPMYYLTANMNRFFRAFRPLGLQRRYKLKKRSVHRILPIENKEFPKTHHDKGLQAKEKYNFIKNNGYIVLPGAVSPGLCDKISNYYDSVLANGSLQVKPKCEFFDKEGKYSYGEEIGDRDPSQLIGLKMLDLYSHNIDAREAMFSPDIQEVLSLIFGANALAFQQLGIIYGTEQDLHQDTAYVRVSEPFLIAASWIALEDITPGSGELELIPGSHNLKDNFFNSSGDEWCKKVESNPSKSAWWNYKDKDIHDKFIGRLRSLKAQQEPFVFNAKKGDCLIWISHLVHGGSPISSRTGSGIPTRKSLVTHYCPFPQAHPIYFHQINNSGPIEYSDNSLYSYKYL
ncbi:conserved hypothetical protein [Prochlorococcus marinus str. MIT 9313]|uniref:Phytanoyl-CoA dioxygenase n=2 Tax=Prochlorococcus marinus TaxID=1219 RepID=Q7V601_PROMM|nr:conserved hypothetical protein [Prochlorococcus marinus str. MIT 9313]